ncbi:MAG: oxidoreductase [Proteobacteria bacterium]|nr:oxidoreductase [Pseudomonadota bacterium]
MNDVKKRTWLITGISSGLGNAVARAALTHGDVVVGTARNEQDRDAFVALSPARAHGYLLDVTDEDSIGRVVANAEAATGGVDILVNNAGYGLIGAIEEASLEEIRAKFEVNVFGAIAVTQAVLPYMRKRRAGHILNISSTSSLAPWGGTGIYGASKYALEGFGQNLAQEVAELGIKVTNVEPGGLRTDFAGRSLVSTAKQIDDYEGTARDALRSLQGGSRKEAGDPDKAAAAILKMLEAEHPPMHFLLGDDALYYTGNKLGTM